MKNFDAALIMSATLAATTFLWNNNQNLDGCVILTVGTAVALAAIGNKRQSAPCTKKPSAN